MLAKLILEFCKNKSLANIEGFPEALCLMVIFYSLGEHLLAAIKDAEECD